MALFEGYQPRGTWIDSVDPRTKLAWLTLVLFLAFTTKTWQSLAVLPFVIVILSTLAGFPLRSFYHPFLVLLVVTVQLLIVQLIFCREGYVLYVLGPLRIYSQALPLATEASLRLWAAALGSMQFLQWTPPGDLTILLVKAKVPYRIAMLVGLAMRLLPMMERELTGIFEVQSARGLPTESARHKLKNILPITLPFLFRSFRRANETALAMELRGFGRLPHRTFLHDLHLRAWEVILILVISAVIIIQTGHHLYGL